MKENKVQTRFERLKQLNQDIISLEEFIKKEKPIFEKQVVIDIKYKLTFFNLSSTKVSEEIPDCLTFDVFEMARKKLKELQNEFNELNKF